MVTQKELLEEIVKELKIDKKDVERTYQIWLEYLNHISNETDQCAITFPNLGKMYISVHKIRTGLHTERLKKFRERKMKEIDKLDQICKYNTHKLSVPIILKYGISKKNSIPYILGKTDKTNFYTVNEIVNNQTSIFFKEDLEFANNKKIESHFKRVNENNKNNKIEDQEQR